MTTWVLVLTLTAWHVYGGNQVATVPGFKSEAACVSAGNAYIKHQEKTGSSATVRALCIPQ